MQMTKPRAVCAQDRETGEVTWIVRCDTHVGIGRTLDRAIERHREKFINRVTGPKAIHRLHRPQQ